MPELYRDRKGNRITSERAADLMRRSLHVLASTEIRGGGLILGSVSTIHLPISDDRDELYETMAFDARGEEQGQGRWPDEATARDGHRAAVKRMVGRTGVGMPAIVWWPGWNGDVPRDQANRDKLLRDGMQKNRDAIQPATGRGALVDLFAANDISGEVTTLYRSADGLYYREPGPGRVKVQSPVPDEPERSEWTPAGLRPVRPPPPPSKPRPAPYHPRRRILRDDNDPV